MVMGKCHVKWCDVVYKLVIGVHTMSRMSPTCLERFVTFYYRKPQFSSKVFILYRVYNRIFKMLPLTMRN
jgi:hypothetical protein